MGPDGSGGEAPGQGGLDPPEQSRRLRIERWVQGGYGLARDPEGGVTLLAGVLPGELVLASPAGRRRGVAWATLERVLEPAPERVQPTCPVAGRCGGCDLRHARWAGQAGLKQMALLEVLERAGVGHPTEIPFESPVEPDGWRCRVRYAAASARGGQSPGGRFGFTRRRSRRGVVPRRCLQAHPLAERLRCQIQALLAAEHTSVDAAGLGVEISDEDPPTAIVTVSGVRGHRSPQALAQRLGAELPDAAGGRVVPAHGRRAGCGASRLTLRPMLPSAKGPLSLTLAVPSGAFFQASHAGNRALVAAVLGMAGELTGLGVLELYAGAGNFTLPLAASGARVLAVEGDRLAVRAAAHNLAAAELSAGARCVAWDLRRGLPPGAGRCTDLVVVDPPRGGLRGVLEPLAELAPDRLIYVSCDPPALARDMARLASHGFAPQALRALDLYPQTHHLEVVVLLERGAAGRRRRSGQADSP